MKMNPVVSSTIKSYGYNPETKVLVIEFKSATYHYKDVPQSVVVDLANSHSVGKFFYANIKGKYEFEKK